MKDQIFSLLPAIFRFHDERQDDQLKAFMRVLESQLASLENDTKRMYDNNFVETCEPWVLPYIGQLVGLDPRNFANLDLTQQRSRVGNALAYARRKGTHAALEKVLASATGWGIRLVVNQHHLNATQNVRALMPEGGKLVDLRSGEPTWVGSSFEQSSRTVSVRNQTQGPNGAGIGGNQPLNVGIHIWRIHSYYLEGVKPFQVSDHLFQVSPIGMDQQMFKFPAPWRDPNLRSDIGTLPGPLFSGPLKSADEDYRRLKAEGERFIDETIFRRTHYLIYIDGKKVPLEHILHTSLNPWPDPAQIQNETTNVYVFKDGKKRRFPIKALVDVDCGRIAFPAALRPDQAHALRVDYAYGGVSELGGGPYFRADGLLPTSQVEAFVCSKGKSDSRHLYADFTAALLHKAADVSGFHPYTNHVIRILDNATYLLPEQYELAANQHLVIESANGHRPCLIGNIRFKLSGSGAKLTLNGVLITGSLHFESDQANTTVQVNLSHVTLVPHDQPSIVVKKSANPPALQLNIYRSICGGIQLTRDLARLDLQDSIISGDIGTTAEESGITFGVAAIQCCTLLGQIRLREIALAANSIFIGRVQVKQRSNGQVRFCYYPQESVLPSSYECITSEKLRPAFVSTVYGHEAYCQLSLAGPEPLLMGADDGGELGAYHHVDQGRRMAALKQVLDEHLPFGLMPDIRLIN